MAQTATTIAAQMPAVRAHSSQTLPPIRFNEGHRAVVYCVARGNELLILRWLRAVDPRASEEYRPEESTSPTGLPGRTRRPQTAR